MSKTKYEINGRDFYINNKLTYQEIPNVNPKALGLLFNARFIQGAFKDYNPENKNVYNRFGKVFDADRNTAELIEALPDWHNAGLRAITVGLQGGGPIYSFTDWGCVQTNSFSSDGRTLNPDTWRRMVSIIKAADEIGMLVIVSFFYQAQFQYFENDFAAIDASKTVCEALCALEYDNVIIEIANEYDTLTMHSKETALAKHVNMASWIKKVQEWTGKRFAVGASAAFRADKDVIQASDISIIHGNMKRRQELNDFARAVRSWAPDQPIVINEDSPMFTQLEVAIDNHFSWGYYNNMTKQEPPCDWGITRGEDEYFVYRMAEVIGIEMPNMDEDSMYLQGFEPDMSIDGGRYIRLASRRPERIDRVMFYEDDELIYTAYAEPFMLYGKTTWIQEPYYPNKTAEKFKVVVKKLNGKTFEIEQDMRDLPKADVSKAHNPSPFNDANAGLPNV